MKPFKLDEFTAHTSSVNCLRIGRKSSGVLVTGGEDRRVNLWAIGKPNAIVSLTGHTSAVESVAFDPKEECVAAGSQTGAIKLWDLSYNKVSRSLAQHRASCVTLQYHPFGDLMSSGSQDCNIKVWDLRRKECIQTIKGHQGTVNQLAVSPDGKWLCSGSDTGELKMWDIGSGRLLRDMPGHSNRVTGLEFHPFEFIMASSSADRTVRVWDLETWEPLQTLGPEAVPVKALAFHKDGRELFSATQDCVRVWSWESGVQQDSVQVDWPRLADMSLTDNRITGCTFSLSAVGVFVVDIRHLKPWAKHSTTAMAGSTANGTTSSHSSGRQQQLQQAAVAGGGSRGGVNYSNLISSAAAMSAMSLESIPEQAAHILAAAAGATSSATSRAASVAPSTATSVAVSRRASFNQPGLEQQGSTTPSRRTSTTQHYDTPTPVTHCHPVQQEQRQQSASQASSRSNSATRLHPAGAAGSPNGALRPGQLGAAMPSAAAPAGGGGEQHHQQQHVKLHDSSSKGRINLGAGGGGYFPDMELRVPANGAPVRRPDYEGSIGTSRETADQAAAAAPSVAAAAAAFEGIRTTSSREKMAGSSGRNLSPMTRSEGPSPRNGAGPTTAVDPILQSVATVHPKIKHQLAVMASALQVAKSFISRGNMEGAYRAIGSHSDPALAAMLLEALQYRPDAFELATVEPVTKLLELLLASGHPQHTVIALNVLACVLRGPGQVMRDTLKAVGGIGCDLSYEQRRSKATVAKLALQGLQLRLGVLSRAGGSAGVHAQQLAAEIGQL